MLAIVDGDVGSFLGKADGDGPAVASTGARYQRHFPFQPHWSLRVSLRVPTIVFVPAELHGPSCSQRETVGILGPQCCVTAWAALVNADLSATRAWTIRPEWMSIVAVAARGSNRVPREDA